METNCSEPVVLPLITTGWQVLGKMTSLSSEVNWLWYSILGLPRWHGGKERACLWKRGRFDSGSGRSPGRGNSNPLQYSCLENSMDRGAWWATVHDAEKSQTRLSNWAFHVDSWSRKNFPNLNMVPMDTGRGKLSWRLEGCQVARFTASRVTKKLRLQSGEPKAGAWMEEGS